MGFYCRAHVLNAIDECAERAQDKTVFVKPYNDESVVKAICSANNDVVKCSEESKYRVSYFLGVI